MQISSKYIIMTVGAMLFFSGCSSKEVVAPKVKKNLLDIQQTKTKAYKFNYVPVIGTQSPDDKVIVDMGVVLRVWINTYKNRSHMLVSSHDIYQWVKKADFITVNELPTKQRGVLTPRGKLPFLLSNETVDRSDLNTNTNIRNFVNSVYEKKASSTISKKQKEELSKFDKTIKDFIKVNKGKK